MADSDPNIQKIKRVGVGNWVRYHGRYGAMRQGRNVFPAVVLKQHEDDGSIDLVVVFEAEDVIWEQRVREHSEQQPNHCWEMVEPIEGTTADPVIAELAERVDKRFEELKALLGSAVRLANDVKDKMYGVYEAPAKSMIEYLDDFDKRLQALEKRK